MAASIILPQLVQLRSLGAVLLGTGDQSEAFSHTCHRSMITNHRSSFSLFQHLLLLYLVAKQSCWHETSKVIESPHLRSHWPS